MPKGLQIHQLLAQIFKNAFHECAMGAAASTRFLKAVLHPQKSFQTFQFQDLHPPNSSLFIFSTHRFEFLDPS